MYKDGTLAQQNSKVDRLQLYGEDGIRGEVVDIPGIQAIIQPHMPSEFRSPQISPQIVPQPEPEEYVYDK